MMPTHTILACRGLALVALVASVHGHGAVTWPRPRNAVDADTAPWNAPVPEPVPFEPWCPFGDAAATGNSQNLTGANGQACFWFSNGCTIGCEACNGNTRGPIPNRKCPVPYDGSNCKMKMPACKAGAAAKATNCAASTRTVNTAAECGADDDWYYFSPWRAPGSAPVFDSCGLAGGRTAAQGNGGFGAQYQDTPNAKQGDAGSKTLSPGLASAVWTVGTNVEVSWALQANHGGGYQYRLCPANATLDEECFRKMPLRFVGQQSFRWGGVESTRFYYNGTYVTEGTTPSGSMWSMNPIPRNDVAQTGQGFAPRCPETADCLAGSRTSSCRCSGMWGPYNLEIVDVVAVPADAIPGDYVLGWRWDCEESSQIWQSCSDITIKAR